VSENGDRPELPEGWEWRPLAEIASTSSGGTPLRSREDYYDGGDIPWVKIGDLTDGEVAKSDVKITQAGLENSSAQLLPAGTLLVAMYGSIGKLGVLAVEAATNQAICAIRPDPDILERDYLFWFLLSERDALLAAGYGGTQANISQRFLRALSIPVPPLAEQRSIASQLDYAWGEIGEGEALLLNADEGFGRFSAAILEATCLGTPSGTASEFPEAENGLLPLPSGWEWVELASLAADEPRAMTDGPFGSNLKRSHYTETGPRVIRLQNIGEGEFLDAEAHISLEHFETLRVASHCPGEFVGA